MASTKEYLEANREKINAYWTKYREANREKINARSKAWREANPERFNDSRNEWNKLHIDRVTKSKVKSELKRQLGFLPADDLINSLAMLRKVKATIKELSK